MITPASFAPLLERFFTQRLMQQRQASPHTITFYRDTFRQFLTFSSSGCINRRHADLRGDRRPADRGVSG